MICSRKVDHVIETTTELKKTFDANIEGTLCHLGDDNQRKNLLKLTLKHFGHVDTLCSFVGVNPAFGTMMDCTQAQLAKLFEVNVSASFAMTQLVVPEMLKRTYQSSILYMGSFSSLQNFDVRLLFTKSHGHIIQLFNHSTLVPIQYPKPGFWQ